MAGGGGGGGGGGRGATHDFTEGGTTRGAATGPADLARLKNCKKNN